MKKISLPFTLLALSMAFFNYACQKEVSGQGYENATVEGNPEQAESNYNLEVVLKGENGQTGHIHFRQDRDAAKIITLDIRVHGLSGNHNYMLQRAVDPINQVDGTCTSTNWLTLGYGLTAHMITTNSMGDAGDVLWRDISAIASGSGFDIHFQVVDADSKAVVLQSDCYQYTVR